MQPEWLSEKITQPLHTQKLCNLSTHKMKTSLKKKTQPLHQETWQKSQNTAREHHIQCQIALSKKNLRKQGCMIFFVERLRDFSYYVTAVTTVFVCVFFLNFLSTFLKSNFTHLTTDVMFS